MNDAQSSVKAFAIMGGTTGLGLSAARALLASGARVAICGRSQESLDRALETLGEGAAGLCGDATDSTISEKLIALCVAEFGSFSGLYHVAGGSGRSRGDAALHEMSDER
jgi:NAD(P)-dependent dehydrogenase (short-subunit alcohol dehydrogenase family)